MTLPYRLETGEPSGQRELLIALAERCEAATGPDRALDAEIAVALKLGCRPNLPDDLEYLSLPNKRDPGPGVTAGHYWFHCRSGMSLRSAPRYTSMDIRESHAACLRALATACIRAKGVSHADG